MYEILMTAVNEVGVSTESPTAFERTREAGKTLMYLNKYISVKRLSVNIASNNDKSFFNSVQLFFLISPSPFRSNK